MGRSCPNGILPCLCLIVLVIIAVCHAQQQQQTQQRQTVNVGGRLYYADDYTRYYYSNYFYRRFYNYFADWYGKIREQILGQLASVCPQQTTQTTALPTGSPSTTPPATTQPATTLQTTTITADTTQSTENQTTASCTCPTTVPTTTVSTNATTTSMNITSTAEMITTTAATEAIFFRIPLAFYPDGYNLVLHPPNPDLKQFDGRVEILMTCREATKKLYLHSSEITIIKDSLEFTMADGSSAGSIVNVTYDQEMQYAIFQLSDEPNVGSQYYIAMNYTGVVQTSTLRGFFTETDEPHNLEAASFSKPYYARSIFPCFDEPAIKATFNVTLVKNASLSYITISSTEIASSTAGPGNYETQVYSTTTQLSTYALGLLIGMEVTSEHKVQGGRFTVTRRNALENETVHETGNDLFRSVVYGVIGVFNTEIPFLKRDVFISRHLFQDGISYAGLILIRESDYLYDATVSSIARKQKIAFLLARQMVQQYIGASVSPNWWDDLGMFEGMVTYLSCKTVSKYSSSLYSTDEQVVDFVIPALDRDNFYVSPPIFTPLEDARDLRKNFSPLSHLKGAALLRMMEFIIGETLFYQRVKVFYDTYAYKSATHIDFMEIMTSETNVTVDGTDMNLKEIMDPFIYQHSFPVIDARSSGSHTAVEIYLRAPQLYGNSGEGFPAPFNYSWTIPITYTHSRNLSFEKTNQDIIWLNSSQYSESNYTLEDATFGDLSTSWFLINVKQMGYYRVMYDTDNYHNLVGKLTSDSYTDIDPQNRAQIVSDLYYFVHDGKIDLNLLINLYLSCLQRERHYIPLKATFEVIDRLDKNLNLHVKYPFFLGRVKTLVEIMFHGMAMNATAPAAHLDALAREMIIAQACRFGVEGCIAESKRLFGEWMANSNINPIDPSIKEAVYCTAIREGSYDEWDFLYTRLSVDEGFTGPEAITMIRALTCTGNPNLISRFIENIIDNTKIRNDWQTMLEAFVSLVENPNAKCDSFDILTDYYVRGNDILNIKGNMDESGGMVRIFESIAKVSTAWHDLIKLYVIRDTPRARIHRRLITMAIEQINQNRKFLSDYANSIGSP